MEPREQLGVHLRPAVGDSARTQAVITDAALLQWLQDWVSDAGRSLEQHRDGHGPTAAGTASAAPDSDDQADTLASLLTAQIAASASASVPPASRSSTGTDDQRRYLHAEFNARISEGSFRGRRHGTAITSPKPIPNRFPDALDAFLQRVSSLFEAGSTSVSSRNLLVSYGIDSTPEETGSSASSESASSSTSPSHRHPTLPQLLAHCALRRAQIDLFNKSNSVTSVHRGSGSADGNASGTDDAIATAWMDLLTSARRVEARLVRFERGLDPDRDNDIDNDELDHVVPAVGNKDAAESALGGERDIDAELDLELDFGDGLRQSASSSSPEPRKLNRSGRGGTKAQKHGHPATTAAVVANAASFASLVQQPASAPRGCPSLLELGKSAGAATMRLVTTDARLPSSATDAAQHSASAPAAIGAGRGASAESADPVMDQLKALRQKNAKVAAKSPSGARIAIVGGGARDDEDADDDGRTGGGAASSSAAQLPKGCAHVWEILLPPSDNMSLRRARIGGTAAAGAGSTIVKLPPGRQLLHWIPATRLRQVLHQRCVSMDNLVRDSDAVGLCRAAAFALRSPVLQDVQQQPQPTSLAPIHLSAFGVSEKIENEAILIDQLLVSLGLERVTSIAELAQLLHSEQRDNSASASAQPAMRSGLQNERDLQNFVSAATARVIVIIDVLESARKLRSMASSDSTVLDQYGILPHLDLLYRHDGAGLLEVHFGSLCLLLAYCALSMSSPSATTRGVTSTIARMLAGASRKLLLHSIASGINSQFGLQKLGGGAAPASPLNGEHAGTIGDDASERSDDEDAHRPLHRLRRQEAVPAASSPAGEHSASRDTQPLTLVQPSLSAVVCALGDIAVQCSHAGVAFHIIQLIWSLPGVPAATSNACERLAAACVFTLYPVPALPHQVPQPPWLLHENGPLSRVAPADVLDQFRFMARSIAYNPSSSGRTHFEDSIALLTHVATCAAEMFAARALPWSTATEFHCATSQNGYHHLLQLQQATKSSVSSSPAQLRASNSNSTAAGSADENDGDGDDAAECDREGDSEDSDPPSYTRGTGLATLSPHGRGRGRGRGGRGAGGNRKRLRYGHLSDTDEDVGDDDDWRGDAGAGRSKRGRGRGRGRRGKGTNAAQGRGRGRGRGGSLSVKPPVVTMALSVSGTEEVAGGDELVALVDPFQDCSDEQLAHIRDLGFSTSQHRPAASSLSSSAPTPLADEGPLSHYVMRTLTPLNAFHVSAVTLELSVRLLDASFTSHSRRSNSTNADTHAFGSLLPVLGVSCAAPVSPHASSSSSSASPDVDDDYVPLRSLLALVRMLVQLCASVACTRASKGQKVGRGSRKADGSQQPYASATDIDAFITFLVDELVPVLNDVAHSLLSDLEVDPIPSACPDARVTAIRSVLHLASEIDTICDCIQAAATIDEVIHRTAARQCNRLKRSNSRLITWMLDLAGQLELNLLGTAVTASASAAAGDVSSSAATVGAMDTPYLPLPASIKSGGRKKLAQSPGGKLLLPLSLGNTLEERSSAAGGNAATSDAGSTSHQNGLLRSPYSRTLLWRRLLLVDRAPIFAYPSVWREGIDAEDDAGGNEFEGADENEAGDGGDSGRHMGNIDGHGVNDGAEADAVQERASGSSATVGMPASSNRARKRDFVIEDDDDIDDRNQAGLGASIQSREVRHNQGVVVPIVAGQSSLASIMDSRTQSQPGDVAPSIVHDAAVASGAVDANSSAAAASDSFAAAASATQPSAALVNIQAMPPAQVHPGQLALQAQSHPLPHPLGPGQQPMLMAAHPANLQQMHPQLQHWAGMGLPSMVAMTPAQAYQLQLQAAMLPPHMQAAAASASYPSYPYAAYQQLQARLQMQMMAMHQQQAVARGTAVAAAASHAPPGPRSHHGDRRGSESDGSRSLSSSSSRRSKKRKSSKKPKHSSSGKKASKSHRSTKSSSKKHQSRKDRSRSRSDSRSSAASDHAASSANSASASASGAGAGASGGDEGGRRRSRHRRKRREEEEEIDYEDDADSGWGGTTSASDWGSQAEEDEDA